MLQTPGSRQRYPTPAAEQAGVATPQRGYRLQWARFDNLTGTATDAGSEIAVGEPRAQAPAALTVPRADADFIQVRVAVIHPHFPSWATPVTVYFRRASSGWELVGLTR